MVVLLAALISTLVPGCFGVLLWWLKSHMGKSNGNGSMNDMLGTLVSLGTEQRVFMNEQRQVNQDQRVINRVIIKSLNRLNESHDLPRVEHEAS